jgi:hypothetical protein
MVPGESNVLKSFKKTCILIAQWSSPDSQRYSMITQWISFQVFVLGSFDNFWQYIDISLSLSNISDLSCDFEKTMITTMYHGRRFAYMIVISRMNIAETCMQIIWRAALSSSHHAMHCCHHSVSIARSRL